MIDRKNAVFRDVYSKEVIDQIFHVHFPDIDYGPGPYEWEGSVVNPRPVADLTWGKGAFHPKHLPDEKSKHCGHCTRPVIGLDYYPRNGAQIGADARHVPLVDNAVDVVIFDPPHQHGVSKTTTLKHQADFGRLPNQKDIHQLLIDVAPEIRRVARVGAIIKLTDMVEAGRFMPTHIMFASAAAPLWGLPCDMAILDSGVVRPMKPNQRVLHLRHAHSYFLIYKWSERAPRSPFWEVES